MLGQAVFDTLLNRLVAGIPRHFVKSSLFLNFGPAISGCFLHRSFIWFVGRLGGHGHESGHKSARNYDGN